ncbi:muconolactone Delta-isomerase family protein [Acidimangrovimonas pyrenivorans]|uniref:Muconolactone Delta-isomerase family protein n=1 Tax=Acidimangrovimonas pyrenivorans TaxID=2030798 RepID=A0ABV7ADA9_9RHOB
MQFLVVSRRRTERFSEAEIAPKLEPEAQMARALYLEGFIRQIWHRDDAPGAVLLIEAADRAALDAGLARLPMYQAGMLEAVQIVPLAPYRGFGPR